MVNDVDDLAPDMSYKEKWDFIFIFVWYLLSLLCIAQSQTRNVELINIKDKFIWTSLNLVEGEQCRDDISIPYTYFLYALSALLAVFEGNHR